MAEIPKELEKFKKSLDGKVGAMSSTLTSLQSKISSLKNETDTAKNGIDSNYDSINKSSLLSSFGNLSNGLSQISSSFGEMNDILSGVNEVLLLVDELISINTELEELENDLNTQKSKPEDEKNYSEISRISGKITELNAKFEKEKNSALEKLNDLKSRDITIDITTSIASSASAKSFGTAGYGEFIRSRFEASNGCIIEYLVYVPDYCKKVDGLPINMYMHGSGTGENYFSRLTSSGLGSEIEKGNVLPSGIVILPLAPTGNTYNNKNFRDALAELPYQVAQDYNGDTKRISLSGHSWGAITAYRLVNENPGEFSAIVTASGSFDVTSAFQNTKIWAFHGSNDDREEGNTGYSKALANVKKAKELGGDAEIYTYEGGGHGGAVLTDTFTEEFERDGEMINPLEWAFNQVSA